MTLTLAISSCPNDTFMFDALINKKIDTGNYDFDILDELTMEYWGERMEGKTTFIIYSNDTLQLNNFNGSSYLMFRTI